MQIEVNRDIDKFKESVALGLTAKQLVYSVLSVVVGGGIVLLIYPYVGLTMSAYIAVPVVAPIAMSGFYEYHGMTFVEMMKLKLHFLGKGKEIVYQSTEDETELKQIKAEIALQEKNKGKMTIADRILANKVAKDGVDGERGD